MSISCDDRALLRDSVRGLLASKWPADHVPTLLADAGALQSVWKNLCGQGVAVLGLDAEQGGLREAVLLQEELGRAACPAPLIAAVLANIALARGPKACAELLQAMQVGEITFAFGLASGEPDEGIVEYRNGTVSGQRAFVEGAQLATHALIETSSGLAIVPMDGCVRIEAMPGYAVPPLSRLTFDANPATQLDLPRARRADLICVARLLLAARAYGSAQRGYEMVIEHAKTRRQFGALIGSFQALQHKLANLLLNLEGVRLTVQYAADRFDAGSTDWRVNADVACAFANQALRQTVLETHHVFGAIGFSEEHEMPRHFRRVHGDVARLGGLMATREGIAQYLLDAGQVMAAFDLGQAANGFRGEVRQFLAEHWNESHRAAEAKLPLETRGWDTAFTRKLAERGLTSLAWPKELGGQGRSALEHFVFAEEMTYVDAPILAHACAVDLIAPAVIAFGTAEQKRIWLPGIANNEITCCLGYSEPEAGSDLASLRTRAECDGDHWIINGQKLWTTAGDRANHVWLAVRTDPAAKPKHAGITIFLVPLDSPGITIWPSMAMYGHTFCTVFYENVRVPSSAMVGGLNNGWRVITHALASERVLMGGRVGILRGIFDQLLAYLRTSQFGGRVLREDARIRDRIGQLAAELEVARHLSLLSMQGVEQGKVPVVEAAMSKVFFGELMERALECAIDILGTSGTMSEDAPEAPLRGRIEQALRTSIMMVVGGGAAEIQRTLIAQQGIGLPRA